MDEDQIEDQQIEKQEDTLDRPLSDRERMMEEIAAKRNAELGIEPDADESEDELIAQDDADQREIQAEQEEKSARLFDGDADQTLVKLKINGEEQEVPLSRLIADAQKHDAADKRLAEASRLLREARQQQAVQPQEQPAPVDTDVAKTFIDALFGSNEEEATEALTKLLARPSAPQTVSVDAEAIAAQVKASIDRDSALQRFANDHPYVMQDPDLVALGDAKLSRRIQAGETFSEALQAVSEEMKRFAPVEDVKDDPPATTRQKVLEQKRSRDHVRGQSMSAATSEPPTLTPSQIIQQMQEQRQRGNWKPH